MIYNYKEFFLKKISAIGKVYYSDDYGSLFPLFQCAANIKKDEIFNLVEEIKNGVIEYLGKNENTAAVVAKEKEKLSVLDLLVPSPKMLEEWESPQNFFLDKAEERKNLYYSIVMLYIRVQFSTHFIDTITDFKLLQCE